MIPDLFWIPGPWTGRLAIVARPRGGDWLDGEACGWRQAGVDVLVSLLEEEEAAELGLAHEGEAAESNGIRFVSFPIPDRGVPASTELAVALLKEIGGALNDGKNVAVHCRQGIGRSEREQELVLAFFRFPVFGSVTSGSDVLGSDPSCRP